MTESEKVAYLRKEIAKKIASINASIALQELLESEMSLQNIAARHMFFRIIPQIQQENPSLSVLEVQIEAVHQVAAANIQMRTA